MSGSPPAKRARTDDGRPARVQANVALAAELAQTSAPLDDGPGIEAEALARLRAVDPMMAHITQVCLFVLSFLCDYH